jgi:hypothetical protein
MRKDYYISLPPRSSIRLSSIWYNIITAFGSAVYLYFTLFTSHGVPCLLAGDQVYYWMGAQQILNGQVIFRDFFQYTPPGTDLIYAAFFNLLGASMRSSNTVVIALGIQRLPGSTLSFSRPFEVFLYSRSGLRRQRHLVGQSERLNRP